MPDSYPRGGVLTSRQFAHAVGVTIGQLAAMREAGEATPTWQLPGERGDYLWTAAEVRQVLANSGNRRMFKRRRKARTKQPLDGLRPVVPKVRVKRTFPAPPDARD